MVLKKTDFQGQEKFDSQIKKKPNRKPVAILFLGTIILSLFLAVGTRFKDWWQKILEPISFEIIKPQEEESITKILGFTPNLKDIEGLKISVELLTQDLAGTYGIYFSALEKKEILGINENEIYIAASVNKVPIMVNFYQQVEKGNFKEDEEYVLRTKDIQDYGTGQMRYQKPGTKYQYRELVELAGKLSDNTAAYVLEQIVDSQKIQGNLESLGMKNTSLKENTTTPKEMGDYLALLYQNKLVKEEFKEKIFTSLTDTDFEDRIPKGVPSKIKVVHKIGNEIQAYNDCGIVFGSKPYVLCILSKEVHEQEALEVLPKISRLVWEYVSQ